MPHKQPNLERQLAHAQQQLDSQCAALDAKGVAEKDRRKNTAWRQLNSVRKSLKHRIQAAAAVVELDEEVKRRKAEKPAKGEDDGGKKSGKKKDKSAKQPKAEGGKKKKSKD